MNDKLRDNKYINGWAATRDSVLFKNVKKGDVALIYNTADGKRSVKSIPYGKKWYFYIENKPGNLDKLNDLYPYPDMIKVGKKYIRVHYPRAAYSGADNPFKNLIMSLEKAGVLTYEADIGPMKRLTLDYNLQIEDWEKIRVLYFDIETDDTHSGIVVGRDRILSFAGVDQNGKEYFLTDPDEKTLLLQIHKLIMDHDMLIGWNSKDFDLPYIKERFMKHKITTEYIYNVLHEDMMRRIQYFYSKDPEARQSISSYSLDYISNYFLKEQKIKHDGQKIIDLYKTDPAKFKEYNLQDCRLLKKLEDQLGTMRLTYMMFQWCGVFAQNWSMVKTIDNFILSDANKKGVHYRTNMAQLFNRDENGEVVAADEEFLGAFVLEPTPGYYKDVYDLDFKSLYPNIIRTFNISPETIAQEGEKSMTTPLVEDAKGRHGGMKYSTEREGIISAKIGQLLDQREEIRKKMKQYEKGSAEWRNLNVQQLIVKELSNSIYGVLGNKWFRSFSVPMAESITATGQYLIKYVKKINEEEGRKVIYGDTDSIFLITKPGEDISTVLAWINKRIEDHFRKDYGVRSSSIQMALDVKFEKFIIETKKKYVGKEGENYKFVGMECIKRDTIPVVVTYQKKLIDKVMAGQTLPKLVEWIEEKKQKVLYEPFKAEDITIRKRLSKDPDSYRAKSARTYVPPIHVRIAQDLKRRKSISEDNKVLITSAGSIIQFIYTKGGEGNKAEGVHISEFTGTWDRVYYWNNVIFPPLERLLKSVYPEEDWMRFYLKKEKSALAKLRNVKQQRTKRKEA